MSLAVGSTILISDLWNSSTGKLKSVRGVSGGANAAYTATSGDAVLQNSVAKLVL